MDPIRYLRRVVIAALNHLTVSYTEASHSWGGFSVFAAADCALIAGVQGENISWQMLSLL